MSRVAAAKVAGMLVAALLVVAALSGCVPNGASAPDPRLEGAWRLTDARDAAGVLPIGSAPITLRIGDVDHSGGESPCSTYSARVTGASGAVFITAKVPASDGCPDGGLGALERRYLDILDTTHLASATTERLVLSGTDGTLRFSKSATPAAPTLTRTTWALESLPNMREHSLADFASGAAVVTFSDDGVYRLSTACTTAVGEFSRASTRFSVTGFSEDVGSGAVCTGDVGTVANHAIGILRHIFTVDLRGSALFVTSDSTGEIAIFRARSS